RPQPPAGGTAERGLRAVRGRLCQPRRYRRHRLTRAWTALGADGTIRDHRSQRSRRHRRLRATAGAALPRYRKVAGDPARLVASAYRTGGSGATGGAATGRAAGPRPLARPAPDAAGGALAD